MDPFHAKVVAGGIGSTVTALTMTPFDVVKTRLQTQPPVPKRLFPRPPLNTCCQNPQLSSCTRGMSSLARPLAAEVVCVWEHGVFRTERVNGFLDAVRHVWRAEGLPGLWKGVGTSLVIGVPSSTSYILTYDYLLNVVLPPFIPSQPLVPLAAGVLARTAITTLASPLELVRTNLQSTPISPDRPNTLRSVLVPIRRLVRNNGFLFLWRGLGPTLWRDVPFSGIYWASYEAWKRQFMRHEYGGPSVAFASGAVSGMTAALLTSPFDVLKTRRQALIMSSTTGSVLSTIPLAFQIARTEGYSAWFAGIMPRMAKIAPACGIMIACYEGIGTFLTKPRSSS
ncbi:mitochondrial carrier [Pluteus cervinus]|uniref:Mitochondrial carrier n=1 Tax=Pluteus cervinus TaxID=181527 RepID=A0ACD3BHJ6_9AGAR|nr:mitochondrial carrier [Pluteus cervinus]